MHPPCSQWRTKVKRSFVVDGHFSKQKHTLSHMTPHRQQKGRNVSKVDAIIREHRILTVAQTIKPCCAKPRPQQTCLSILVLATIFNANNGIIGRPSDHKSAVHKPKPNTDEYCYCDIPLYIYGGSYGSQCKFLGLKSTQAPMKYTFQCTSFKSNFLDAQLSNWDDSDSIR